MGIIAEDVNNVKIRISGIINESIVDGPGLRMVVFAQGCNRACPGCHNPETHALDGGYETSAYELFDSARSNPLLRGITFSGGEPFLQARAFSALARLARGAGLDIFTYTGYTIEELLEISGIVNDCPGAPAKNKGAFDPAGGDDDSDDNDDSSGEADTGGEADTSGETDTSGFRELLELTDILVDGAYVQELRTFDAPYRGSENQRVIDVAATLRQFGA